jgi:TIR domain
MADIFISYSRSDKAFAERLYRELERFNVHGFMDDSDLAAGSEWSTRLRETVRNADAVLVILSKSAARSNWVLAEIGLADTLGKKVSPCLGSAGSLNVLGDHLALR